MSYQIDPQGYVYRDVYHHFVYDSDLKEIATAFCDQHKRKMYLAQKFPDLKFDELELLSDLVTDQDIEQYEKDSGN